MLSVPPYFNHLSTSLWNTYLETFRHL